MKPEPIGLRQMLDLLIPRSSGGFDEVPAAIAKQRLLSVTQSDPVVAARWKQLNRLAAAAKPWQLPESAISHPQKVQNSSLNEFEMAERMAAFLDGTMNASETGDFETGCWNDERMLSDLIVLFRAGRMSASGDAAQGGGAEVQSQALTSRLVDLFPLTTTDSVPEPSAIPVIRPVKLLRNRSQPHRKLLTASWMATAALALAAMGLAWFFWSPSQETIVEAPSGMRPDSPARPAPELVQRLLDEPETIAGTPEGSRPRSLPIESERPDPLDLIERAADRGAASQLAANQANSIPPDAGDPPARALNTPPVIQPPTETDIPSNRTTSMAGVFERTEGVVAIRENESEAWMGIAVTDGVHSDSVQLAVLPFSWCQASFSDLGSWTLAENTLLTVSRDLPGGATSMELAGGRLAVAEAAIDSVFAIKTPSGTWTIRTQTADTLFAVQFDSSDRVLVQKGAVTVNGIEVAARQQLVWSGTEPGRPQRLAESIAWIRKPERNFPERDLARAWSQSPDLVRDMGQLDELKPKSRTLARHMVASLDPNGQAVSFLGNELPEVRAEGIGWLLEFGSDPQRLQRLAAAMASDLSAPGLATTLPRVVIAIRSSQMPQQSDSELLVTGLDHRNPSVRRISHALLLRIFGALVDYDSESGEAVRTRQSAAWRVRIQQIYTRLGNARRR